MDDLLTQAIILFHTSLGSEITHQNEFTQDSPALIDSWLATQPSFLEILVGSNASDTQFVWGDVLKGIEEMSHNVTAALLTLPFGMMKSNCSLDLPVVVYQYTSLELWAPYGVSNFLLLSCCLTFSLIIFYRWPWALL
jgi:hypothetical protein